MLRNRFWVLAVLVVGWVACVALGQVCPGCEFDEDLPFVEPGKTCTIIAVGKNATVDGSVITGQSCDCGSCDFTIHLIPAADHPEGATRKIYLLDQYSTYPDVGWTRPPRYEKIFSGVEIPEVPHTHAYIHGIFGNLNDRQLQINESTIGGRRELRNTPGLFTISELTMIAMERCSTAREAIKLMGELAEKYGYNGRIDSAECLAVADPNEVWIFEIYGVGPLWTPESGEPGAIWAARRVPDDEVAVVPNHSIIGVIDFEDKENFMYCSHVVDFAVKNGWYDPASGKPFNFSDIYDPRYWKDGTPITPANSYGYYARIWRALNLLAPSQNFSPDLYLHDYPFSVKPDKKLTLQDIFAFYRDHYEGTFLDMTKGVAAGPFENPNRYPRLSFKVDGKTYYFARPIESYHCDYVSICVSRSWLPDPIGGVFWLGLGESDTTCFMPIYIGVNELPKSITIGNHWEFDRESARWAFDYVTYHTLPFYSLTMKYVKEAQDYWETVLVLETQLVDQIALQLYNDDPAKAKAYLTDYSKSAVDRVVKAWWELGDKLLVYFNHGYIYSEPGKRGSVSWPEWWLRLIIEKDQMQPVP